MKTNYDYVISNMKLLHSRKSDGRFKPHVILSRVGSNEHKDTEFIDFVSSRFPLFKVKVAQKSVWLCDLSGRNTLSDYNDMPCRQWFQLHILADGKEAFCCIDAEEDHSSCNTHENTLLEMHDHPRKTRPIKAAARHEIALCRGCVLPP